MGTMLVMFLRGLGRDCVLFLLWSGMSLFPCPIVENLVVYSTYPRYFHRGRFDCIPASLPAYRCRPRLARVCVCVCVPTFYFPGF